MFTQYKKNNQENTRSFHISDILSITTGRYCSKSLDSFANILRFMTDDDTIFSHQIFRIARECKPYILEQYPQLDEIDCANLNENTYQPWLEKQMEKYGETLAIKKLPANVHKIMDPIEELLEIRNNPNDKVLVVKLF